MEVIQHYSTRLRDVSEANIVNTGVRIGGMTLASTSPTTVFEVAPSSSGGEVFWIYEIENPEEFFTGCETEEEASERLIESDRSPDEQLETCGYTLILDHPEDPPSNRSVPAPEMPIILEVIRENGQNQRHEFYRIDDPVATFDDAWGDTSKMFDSIREEDIEPVLYYDNVSLRFQRPYGSL